MAENSRKRSPNGVLKPYQIKDGRYRITANFGQDETGKRLRHTESGKTEQEVIDKMKLWLSKNGYLIDEAVVIINEQSTAQELVKEFKLKSLLASGISDVTFENYSYSLKHFETYFKDWRLCMIDTDEMNRFFTKMVNAMENGTYKYGKCSLERAQYIIDRMFNWAVEKDYLSKNPMVSKNLRKPEAKKKTTPITALSAEDIDLLRRILQKNQVVYPVIYLMSVTGMRTQEALALHWEDIDFDNGIIHIHRALVKKIIRDENGNKIKGYTDEGPTKRGTGDRDIAVPDEVMELLKEWKRTAAKVSKTKLGNSDYIFGHSKGPRWTCDGFRSSVNHCLENSEAGMDRLRLHRLRHTVATMLSDEPDATVFNIMQLLGHTQIKTAQKYIDAQTDKRRQKNKELLGRLSKRTKLCE